MVGSTLSFSIMQLIVKLSSGVFHTMELVFCRNLITLFFGLFLAVQKGMPLLGKKENRTALLLRSFFGYVGVVGYFYATTHMNVADASLLHRSSPFFVIIFSAMFLKNRLKRVQVAALVLAFCGSVLVIRPSFDMSVIPALVGVLSAAGAGAAYVAINYLKGKEDNSTIIFCFSLFSCVCSAALGWREFVMPAGAGQWIMLLGVGIFAGVGQVLLTQAYKMTNPGDVSIINYLGIIFSAVFGVMFLSETLELRTVMGIALIFSAAALLYFIKDSKAIGKAKG